MIDTIVLSRKVKKQLRKVPRTILDSFAVWVRGVELHGVERMRKIPGYHDEPLKGQRRGQRSIRLSRSYRAIYAIRSDDSIEFVSVEEVSKHDY